MQDLNDIILQKSTFGDLTMAPLRYVVPPYQRAYMWTKRESKSLFNDIIKRFRADDYIFLNGITLSSATLDSESTEKKIVDGQQRLLTLAIYLRAIIDILNESNFDSEKTGKLENSLFDHINGKKHLRFKSQHIYANEILNLIFTGESSKINYETLRYPATKFTDMYLLSKKMLLKEVITSEQRHALGEFLLAKVFFSVTTTTPENEVSIFKTMNTTGLPLSGFDKLRIELYELTPTGLRNEFNIKWSDFTKYIWELSGSEEATITYIGRGITDNHVGTVELMNSIVDLARKQGVIKFIDETLLPSVIALSYGMDSRYPCGEISVALRNLNYLSRVTRYRSIRPLLVASRKLSHADSDKVFEQLLNTILVLSLSESRPQYNEDFFKDWSDLIQSGNIDMAVISMKALVKEHSVNFRKNFPILSLPYLGSDGVRFILAIAEQNILTAIGSRSQLELSCILPAEQFDIEHIAPSGYAKEDSWSHLGLDFYTDSLANLTMLEKTRNRSVGNRSFDKKVKEYSLSKSYVTSMISEDGAGGGKNNGAVLASKKFRQYSFWNSEQMSIRNQQLADILCEELGVTPGLIDQPLLPLVADNLLIIPQGRPENAIKILHKVRSGMTSLVELREALNISSENYEEENISDRNFNYNLEALEYLGLGYRVDGTFTLSDTGDEIFCEELKLNYDLLGLCFTASLIRSGLTINNINKIKSNHTANDKQDVIDAFSILFPSLSSVTLGHRVSGIFSWAKFIHDRV